MDLDKEKILKEKRYQEYRDKVFKCNNQYVRDINWYLTDSYQNYINKIKKNNN